MGSGIWSTDVYAAAASYRAAKGTSAFAYSDSGARAVHDDLDPYGVAARESRDSGEHPDSLAIAVLFGGILSIATLFGGIIGFALIAIGLKAGRDVNLLTLNVLAVMTALNAVLDLWLLVGNTGAALGTNSIRNDAAAFQAEIAPLIPAPVWALLNPAQSWRIFAPLPPDQTRNPSYVRANATDAYLLEPAGTPSPFAH